MSDESPPPVANMQNIVDRTITAAPSSAYKGSAVGGEKSIWITVLVVAIIVAAVVVAVILLSKG